jgi:hypothetical protein
MKLKTPQHTQETAKVAEAPVVDLATQLAAHALPDAFRAQVQAPSVRGLATMMSVASGATAVPDYDLPTEDFCVNLPGAIAPLASELAEVFPVASVPPAVKDYGASFPPPLGFAPELKDRFEIAEYVAANSSAYVDEEFISEACRGAKAVLKRMPVGEIREGDPDHNLPDKRKENRYGKMDPSTMPPLLVDEEGKVWDGNHRLRVARNLGLGSVWCYQLEDE